MARKYVTGVDPTVMENDINAKFPGQTSINGGTPSADSGNASMAPFGSQFSDPELPCISKPSSPKGTAEHGHSNVSSR